MQPSMPSSSAPTRTMSCGGSAPPEAFCWIPRKHGTSGVNGWSGCGTISPRPWRYSRTDPATPRTRIAVDDAGAQEPPTSFPPVSYGSKPAARLRDSGLTGAIGPKGQSQRFGPREQAWRWVWATPPLYGGLAGGAAHEPGAGAAHRPCQREPALPG